ncbi:unnamed protein product [Tilletia controversa]|nr:unnamed protein product [Tilletia controversa]
MSTSPSTVLLKSLAPALGASAVVLRKSGRASSGAIAAKEADQTFEQVYSNKKFGRDLLVLALLKVEHGCCLNSSSDASAIVEAIAVADDAVKESRQAVSNGNLAPQGRPILARALVMQGRALVKDNRVADAQVSFEEGIALYRGLLVKCSGLYEVQLAEALCRAADTFQRQDPAKHYQCLRQARELYEGQRLRWASFRLQAYHRAVGTFKNEIASLTLALQNSQKVAIEYLRKACRLAFIDFEGASKFAKVSEILNLVDVTSAKDVRPTQVHYLAAALYISGYSNLICSSAPKPLRTTYIPPSKSSDAHYPWSTATAGMRAWIYGHAPGRVWHTAPWANSTGAISLFLMRFVTSETDRPTTFAHSAEGRSVNVDYKKTAWSLKARILEANRRSEGVAEALGEADKVERRDFSYIFTFTESEEEVPVSP